MMSFTLSLDSPLSQLSTTGGKGHNLSVLSQNGDISVPPGFAVTIAAYHDFVNNSGLLQEIKAALADLSEEKTPTELEKVSQTIRDSFRRKKLSPTVRAEILQRITDLFPDPKTHLAVRSSGTCEDMPDASFAGQHDTYLNVNPSVDNVCEHVVDCFSSLFTSRAISYRDRNGLSHIDAGMAVVVQAMVQSHSSGVLFTANPLTGRRNESVLEAIPGLGEALVSGLTEPDRYVVKRCSDGSVTIKDKKIGGKMKAIRSVEGGGVKEEISDSKDTSAVLTDDAVKDLIGVGQQVAVLFDNSPQDIEWARSEDGKIYIVQSRPITTLFPLPDLPMEPLQVLFSFNAVQGISAPIYPAGMDAIRFGVLAGLINYMTWGKFGLEGRFLVPVAGRMYANVTNLLRNAIGRKILLKLLPAVEPGIYAGIEQLLSDPSLTINSSINLSGFLRLISIISMVLPRLIMAYIFPDWSREKLIRIVNHRFACLEKNIPNVNNLSDAVEVKQTTLQSFFPSIVLQFLPRMATAMGSLRLLSVLASSLPDGDDLVLTITRGLPHNVTTEMDLKLWQVAKRLQKDETSLDCIRNKSAADLADDYLNKRLPRLSQEALQQFMGEYGMRGLYEIDFGRVRWREDPTPLMQVIKSYIEIDESMAPDVMFAKGEVEAEKAIETLGQKLGMPWLVKFIARRVRCIAGVRELPKFMIIRMMGVIREVMIKEGSKLAEQNIIDDAKDVFLLHDNELRALSDGKLNDCKNIIKERKAEMERETNRTRVPRVIASDGFAFFGGSASNGKVKEGANVQCGEPVSPGVYEGRIRVVHNPSETTLLPGEILCCHGTDPSWTPLFLSAGALVMEVGGLMTHGSVVAREYGIPAVVGIEDVTNRLSTGQLVKVDGSSGIVEILEKP